MLFIAQAALTGHFCTWRKCIFPITNYFITKFGLKVEVKVGMNLPEKYSKRLHTKNFRKVTSEAATSIDYNPKLKIIEIEYKTGRIYHYPNMNKKVWSNFLELADKGKGLGVYINQDFKTMIDENNYDYYEL